MTRLETMTKSELQTEYARQQTLCGMLETRIDQLETNRGSRKTLNKLRAELTALEAKTAETQAKLETVSNQPPAQLSMFSRRAIINIIQKFRG